MAAKREERAGERFMVTGKGQGRKALGREEREVKRGGEYKKKVLSEEEARRRQVVSSADRGVSSREATAGS